MTPWTVQPTRLLRPWGFPGKDTRVGCHLLFQGIFLTQGSNPCLLHWQAGSCLLLLVLLLSRSVVSDSVRPQRRQPARLPRPWDSPGKNSGVGCHFLLRCMKVKSESEVAQSCLTLSDAMDCSPPGSSVHGTSRKEYWSGVPLSHPYIYGSPYIYMYTQSYLECWSYPSRWWHFNIWLPRAFVLLNCVRLCLPLHLWPYVFPKSTDI